ncbi:phosphoribosylamine--glycine ligase [Pyrobaculum neutrophilum]|uniref:phosphoribosylamine--glycine ligase n=1 Tax=Pyrobaculum neutrophilum (strain DSM 2338 / JCM 9278 / NBRC 100436 / V24Sta) TaxID=444157 RepID=B1YBM0_PYRNV|nr:phosphoribosylamine--glycine ligase [Pyrobaculum neutrophilum]ACB40822.1 phosphoribosylamine--glycine ligase [Pyrobaculum neutrophilum V24Sta]
MEKVLIVGDGAREHAIAWALERSGVVINAVVGHRNPGIEEVARRTGGRLYLGSPTDPGTVVKAAEDSSPDLVVIGPEEPLFAGVSDALRERGFRTLGASRRLSIIEMRKDFARSLQWKYGVPGRLIYGVFKDVEEAYRFSRSVGAVAIKPIRQAGGKGVRVIYGDAAYLDFDEVYRRGAEDVLKQLAGYRDVDTAVLVEEAVWGVEFTVQALTDGESMFFFPPVQDNPHAYEYGVGPECGGMGTVSPLPFLEEGEVEEAKRAVELTVKALGEELGERYVGVISGQMMLTARGPVIIEYYSRLGDPEALNALYLYGGDAYTLFSLAADGKLHKAERRFREEHTVVKALAPLGYPHRRDVARGRRIYVDWDVIKREGCLVFFSSVEERDGAYVTLGSRALEILAPGRTAEEAYQRSERCMSAVGGDGVYYRRDIGSPEYMSSMAAKAEKVRAVYRWRRERGLGGRVVVWEPGVGLREYKL